MKIALIISIIFNIFFLYFCLIITHYCNVLKKENESLVNLLEDVLENDTDYINQEGRYVY